jgi:hypothetical protein
MTCSLPPFKIVVAILLPPLKTSKMPETVVPTALPPLLTTTEPLSIVLLTVPPKSTFSRPPKSTMTPVLVCPDVTLSV